MTRRSAFAVAGGVVAALGAGIVATIVNIGVLNASEPEGPGQLRADEPVVRTVTETKTIHRKAKGSGSGGVVTIERPGTTPPGSNGVASASREDDEAFEDDDAYEEDEGYEDESESEDGYEGSEDEEHEFDEGDDD